MASQPLEGIEHIVVLMLENRSFDNILGGLSSLGSPYTGSGFLTGKEWNPVNPLTSGSHQVHVWGVPNPGQSIMTMPYPDPGELFSDMNQQIFGSYSTAGPANMMGFVWNYANLANETTDPRDVMHYYRHHDPVDLPITSALAQNYAVCDQWFGSGPTQTFPNRVFAHCGAPGTYTEQGVTQACVNDVDYAKSGLINDTSIFELLGEDPGWTVYYNDYMLSMLVEYVASAYVIEHIDKKLTQHILPYANFAGDCQSGSLAAYSFIEPRYSNGSAGEMANSNHPGGSVITLGPFTILGHKVGPWNIETPNNSICWGEQLLQQVYTSLASNQDLFKKTLLIVTYDEHGGLYDHVPPPAAVSPWPSNGITSVTGFNYNRYGPRVPTLFINPYIQSGTIWSPPGSTPFDHTSIISTLMQQFGLSNGGNSYLTPRDQSAPTLAGLIDTSNPLNPFSPGDLPTLNCS